MSNMRITNDQSNLRIAKPDIVFREEYYRLFFNRFSILNDFSWMVWEYVVTHRQSYIQGILSHIYRWVAGLFFPPEKKM